MRSSSGLISSSNRERLFVEYAWDRFDVLHVLAMLMSPTASFFGQREILFAALGAWIVAPKNDKLRKAAIIRSMVQMLVSIEATGRAKLGVQLVVSDVCSRLMKPGIAAFYEEVYYPIGGLKTLTGPLSQPNFFQYYHESTGKIDTALEIAEIYHCHFEYLSSNGKYRQASLNTAAQLVRTLERRTHRQGGDAIDNIKKQWTASRESISLAYASSSMRFRRGSKYTDLLHVMQSGTGRLNRRMLFS